MTSLGNNASEVVMVEPKPTVRFAVFDEQGRRIRTATPSDLTNFRQATGGYYVYGHGCCTVEREEVVPPALPPAFPWFESEYETQPKKRP